MAIYRVRVDRLRHAAIDKKIKDTGNAIAAAAGLPPGTVNAVIAGRPPRNPTMAALVQALDVPFEELFELVDDVPA